MAENRENIYQEQLNRMKESTKGFFRTNSQEYQAVLTALKDVVDCQNMEVTETATKMVNAHQQLGKACEEYLRTREGARTKSGKERLDIVSAIYTLQQKEKDSVNEMRNPKTLESNVQKTWQQVLAVDRVREINTQGMELGTVGAGSSFRTVVPEESGKGFFTENNYMMDKKQFYASLAERAKSERVKATFLKFSESPDQGALFEQIANNGLNEQLSAAGFESKIANNPSLQAEVVEWAQMTPEEKRELASFGEEVGKHVNVNYVMGEDAMIKPGANIPMRNVASTRLAELLGQGDLLAKSEHVRLNDGKTIRDGVIMAEAKGIDVNSNKREHVEMFAGIDDFSDPNLMRQLTNLEILDYLSGQVDRNVGNMFYQFETVNGQKKLTGIQGIDNDAAFGLQTKEIGQMARLSDIQVMDAVFRDNLYRINRDVLEYTFGDILNKDEIDALEQRIETAKTKLMDVRPVSPENWDKIPPESENNKGFNSYVNKVKNKCMEKKTQLEVMNKAEKAAEAPAAEAPAAEAPAAEAPAAEAPAAEAPAAEAPAAEAPAAKAPAAEEPAAKAPAAEAPAAEAPAAEAPAAEAPAAKAPAAEAPAAEAPAAKAPAAKAPAAEAPAAKAPAAEAPAAEAPAAKAPAAEAPAAKAPAAEAPAAEAPAAEAQTTTWKKGVSPSKSGRVEMSLESLERAEKAKPAPAKATQTPQRKSMIGVQREKPTIGGHRPKK